MDAEVCPEAHHQSLVTNRYLCTYYIGSTGHLASTLHITHINTLKASPLYIYGVRSAASTLMIEKLAHFLAFNYAMIPNWCYHSKHQIWQKLCSHLQQYIHGLVQERHNSSALAMELHTFSLTYQYHPNTIKFCRHQAVILNKIILKVEMYSKSSIA